MRIRTYILSALLFALAPLALAQEKEDIYRIEKVSVSTRSYNEMTPVLTEDGIAFCSDRKSSAFSDVRTFDRSLLYNIYFASRKDSMEWNKSRIFAKDLSPLANEGPFCFTPDGQQIYYSSNLKQGKNARKQNVDNNRGIFIADKQGDGWTNIRPFKHNDPLYNVAHPYISSDGKLLFFASDFPGGEGGSDIWYCEWVNGEWAQPKNLGPEINSSSADLYPWYSPSGELFLASDRNGGIGGLDLYSSSHRFGQWKKAVLLPEPINSRADDFSYMIEAGTSNGFFTSNREQSDDIFRFTSLIIRKNVCEPLIEDQFCYEFFDENAKAIDKNAYEYEWDFGDGHKTRGDTVEHCFENQGNYIVKLNVINKLTDEVKENETSLLLDIERTVQAYIESPDTCAVGERIDFDAAMTNLPGWDIEKYYWNFDDGTIATGITTEKVFTEPGTYIVQLIVTSAPNQDGVVEETCVSKNLVVR